MDNAYSNPFYDGTQTSVQTVGVWRALTPDQFSKLDIPLEPLAVVRVKIVPDYGSAPLYFNAPSATVIAGQTYALPAPPGPISVT